jgi:tetratricopeptide (TPR) repeat protein
MNAPYIMDGGVALARLLHQLGRWDDAVAALPEGAEGADALRAEILVDRFFWRLDQAEQARAAVAAVAPAAPVLAGFLDARLAYTRLLFDLAPEGDDRTRAHEGLTAAVADDALAGWATFWLGVVADNLDEDPDTAGAAFERAREIARDRGDALLESYAVRHQAAHLLERDRDTALGLLRRSYHLRAALGARPQTAAAAVTLAGELPAGAEADALLEMADRTARELRLTWLLPTV